MNPTRTTDPLDAAPLDAADPLADFVDRFVPAPGVTAYLDGNSLGGPCAPPPTVSPTSSPARGAPA